MRDEGRNVKKKAFSRCPYLLYLIPHLSYLIPFLTGCGGGKPPSAPVVVSTTATPAAQKPLPTDLRGETLEASILESLRKRVMGRRASLPDVKRIVTEISPIVAAAARQPSVQATFQAMAQEEGISIEEARQRWIALHEADIMLESGGDPDAVSVSNAVGVAQWMARTAHDQRVPVNLRESNRLTAKIDPIKRKIAWLEYLARPDAVPNLPGAPRLSREQAIARLPKLKQELESLREKRRRADARYDPRRAIFAQTRYLLRLFPRFPAMDWIFQAYHGGEAGATRTLKRYLGSAWPGSTAAAIRTGNGGRRLHFEDVYLNISPKSRSAAFDYVYGRSDDHRHYWWKLLVCQQTIGLYRRDPAAFQKAWEALLPGRVREAIWYPDGPQQTFPHDLARTQALDTRTLVKINRNRDWEIEWPFVPTPAGFATLKPEALGLLRLIAKTYRDYGGKEPLRIGDMTLTPMESEMLEKSRRLPPKGLPLPPDPEAETTPGGGPPVNFDYHLTGLAFDLWQPGFAGAASPYDARDRKILDYAIGYWEDRMVVARRNKKDRGTPRWHLVPNPEFRETLIKYRP